MEDASSSDIPPLFKIFQDDRAKRVSVRTHFKTTPARSVRPATDVIHEENEDASPKNLKRHPLCTTPNNNNNNNSVREKIKQKIEIRYSAGRRTSFSRSLRSWSWAAWIGLALHFSLLSGQAFRSPCQFCFCILVSHPGDASVGDSLPGHKTWLSVSWFMCAKTWNWQQDRRERSVIEKQWRNFLLTLFLFSTCSSIIFLPFSFIVFWLFYL